MLRAACKGDKGLAGKSPAVTQAGRGGGPGQGGRGWAWMDETGGCLSGEEMG